MKEKMWALLVHLGTDLWYHKHRYDDLAFDDKMWDYILEKSVETGINTIVLDLANGVVFESHPEIATKGAWTTERVRREVKRCKEMGLTPIPKLNFSATHCRWMGEYARMISTSVYYKVCSDLIHEVYDLFENPEYIHIGMDEEDMDHVKNQQLVVFRQGELYWHDMRYLLDCVKSTGAKPWIWSCSLFKHPEEFKKHIKADEALVSPWYYAAFRKENWRPITDKLRRDNPELAEFNFVEEHEFYTTFRDAALPLAKEGFSYVPCASVAGRCDVNSEELMFYFKEGAPDSQVVGFMTAPWCPTLPTEEFTKRYGDTFRLFKAAKEKIYK